MSCRYGRVCSSCSIILSNGNILRSLIDVQFTYTECWCLLLKNYCCVQGFPFAFDSMSIFV